MFQKHFQWLPLNKKNIKGISMYTYGDATSKTYMYIPFYIWKFKYMTSFSYIYLVSFTVINYQIQSLQ